MPDDFIHSTGDVFIYSTGDVLRMLDQSPLGARFGEDYLWVQLATRKSIA